MNRDNFYTRQNEECPEACCPNTGELAPNFGFEGDFVASNDDLVPEGWFGFNVTQETRQQFIHSGEKAVVLGRRNPDDAGLTTGQITEGVSPGCFYILSFTAGGEGPANFTGELIFIDSMGNETTAGTIQIIGQSKVSGVGVYYRAIFGPAPADLAAVRIEFNKIGVGSVDLDDVSLTIA
ncbi:MAG TPA: hypothetical protein GXX69_05080 [Firmicutes bacterium]|jgi:hypothetical protein|nr:hypothetical protein [Bacillota bacterium]